MEIFNHKMDRCGLPNQEYRKDNFTPIQSIDTLSIKSAKIQSKYAILINALKMINQQLVQRDKPSIEQFIERDQSLKLNARQKRLISQCWRCITDFQSINKSQYQEIIEITTGIANRKINNICDKLTENQQNYYERIVKQNKRRRRQNPQKLPYLSLSVINMVKLDILSIFFHKNYINKQRFIDYFNHGIITYTFFSKLFGFVQSELHQYFQHYEQMEEFITYDRDWIEDFQGLINFLTLVELRKKYIGTIRRRGKEILQQECNTAITFNQHESFAMNPQYEAHISKFSETLFLVKGMDLLSKKLTASRTSQIIDKLRIIMNISCPMQQRLQLFRIKQRYDIYFRSLLDIFNGLTNNTPQFQEQYAIQLKMKRQLMKCQWTFLNNEWIYRILRKLTGCPLSDKEFVKFQGYICNILLQLAIKRFQLYSLATQLQICNFLKYNLPQRLYACRLQYSYNRLKGESLDKDLVCTLILVTNASNIQFYVIQFSRLRDINFFKSLKRAFTKFRKSQNLFFLFLYQFKLRKIMSWQAYIQLLDFFKKKYNCFVYNVNMVNNFRLHYLLDAAIRTYLQLLSGQLTANNFYEFVSQVIIMTISKMRNNLSNLSQLKFIEIKQ